MTANEKTASISPHYVGEYQHWDLVLRTGLDYLAGNATKYVARWRKKGGLVDLQKALHYVQKLEEAANSMALTHIAAMRPSQIWILQEVKLFCDVNELTSNERRVILLLATWRARDDFVLARDVINEMIKSAVPATDSNKHAERV